MAWILGRLLQYYEATVKMDSWGYHYYAQKCGYFYEDDRHDINPSTNHDLWYKYEGKSLNLFKRLTLKRQYVAYKMTIAVFETINYWCWHECPLKITFNREGLKRTLCYGKIYIDWNSYQYKKNRNCIMDAAHCIIGIFDNQYRYTVYRERLKKKR